ncbi:MAG TPA: glycosyltransferase [Stellaceae bacterium]|nr:glycosyltransferase [Stellaceae bacterium]
MNETAVILPALPRVGEASAAATLEPVRVYGKFFFVGERKFHVKGVTYGPFPIGSHGGQFPEREVVAKDFAMMAEMGATVVRVFTVPPLWLLDMAAAAGLRMLVGLPWSQHVAFLESRKLRNEIVKGVSEAVRGLKRHPAIFAYLIGNEIPPDMVRWHGPKRVRAFLMRLMRAVKAEDPAGLVSYANFPSTEYLTIDFTDFLCFNVYLHDEDAFRRYLSKLQNLAVDRPLVLTEFGIDSFREGQGEQARILSWQIRAAFDMGVAGTFVFAWTDEWFTGGHLIENWAFGLVDRDRAPKPAFAAVARRFREPIPPQLALSPRVSVVVCAYNAERTMEACLASLEVLKYPNYEVIVVNDGSTDRTLEISRCFPYCRIISQPNKGLSVARNVGAEAATGEIVAYTDSDCVADPDWLTYLVSTMERRGLVACGGPNFPPPEDSLVPSAVAVSPGGPTHVLLTDDTAEHIAGCNMAFRRDALLALGGFDPLYRAAGDDVDICWRFQDAGHTIGFSPAATVWHFRRNTVRAYIGQQRGYGKAEALVYAKHPFRFNLFGQAKWLGRIYGDLSASLLLSRQPLIYSGVFGRGLFQTMYEPPSSLVAVLPLSFEWNVASLLLAILGGALGGWYWLLLAPLLLSLSLAVNGGLKAPIDKRFRGVKARALVALLIYVGPFLRGWERLKWRFKGLSSEERLETVGRIEQKARVSWRSHALFLSYWSERGDEKETILAGLMRVLAPLKYFVVVDAGWSDWDLKISRGLWSRALVLCCVENHGGNRRLLHVRCTFAFSRLARLVLKGYLGAAVLALVLGAPVVAAAIGLAGLVHGVLVAHHTVELGRIMHEITDGVARQAGLTPVTPIRKERAEPALAPSAA